MLFNSFAFAAFGPVVYATWRLLPKAAARWWLLAASLFFYGSWDWRFLGLLVATSTLDWALALQMESTEGRARKALVTTSVVVNLSTLAIFKYLGFFAAELGHLLARFGVALPPLAIDVVLPVGISFYTFQAIGYSVDVYRRELPAVRRLPDFLLFITFFPHLVAGPIQRSAQLLPQLAQMQQPSRRQMSEGAWLILWGYAKKVVVADNLAPLVATAFDDPHPGGFRVLLGAVAFTWQIYCDFSGYSDIARGLAKGFGVELLENFARPFFAASPQEIWRRWHVSLSQWLRDYLYIPLGGNQNHPGRNLILTMLLGGLWHGANWTYVLWGLWHGVALALGRVLPRVPGPRLVRVGLTFLITCFGFVIFRAHSAAQLIELGAAVAGGIAPTADDLAYLRLVALLIAPIVLVEAWQERGGTFVTLTLPRPVQGALSAALVAAVAVLGSTYAYQFIYFQF